MSDNATPKVPRTPSSEIGRDPIYDLVNRLERAAPALEGKIPELARSVQRIVEAAQQPDPEIAASQRFRVQVAYALQDMEKLSGPIGSIPQSLREEMGRLATTLPGLKNERLQDMLRATPGMNDARLVRDIRDLAQSVAARGEAQEGPVLRDRIDALENRVRLAMSPTAEAPPATRASGTEASRIGPEAQPGEKTAGAGAPLDKGKAARSPGSEGAIDPPAFVRNEAVAQNGAGPNQEQIQVAVPAKGPGVVGLSLAALGRIAQQENPTMERDPTSVAERSSRHDNIFQQRRDEHTVQGAERSQRAALEALQAYAGGPASGILSKIQNAAKSDPGGMQGVLSEMREGGKYADLRSQFNGSLVAERGAAAAWDRMAASVQQYGVDRAAVAAIGARQASPAALEARFEKMDAEIGKAASSIPSRQDGKSVIDDLGEKVRIIIERAIEAVKSVFRPEAERTARQASGPSPGI